MRIRNRRWIFFGLLIANLQLGFCEEIVEVDNSTQLKKENANLRGIFSPRMDYDQWKPLGRGDPLKNDPTYDYVPPVLDRVHYWVDTTQRKPEPPLPGENQKTEILLLGVSSKKPSSTSSVADSRRDTYDPFLKFVEGPKFNSNSNNNNNQRVSRPHYQIPSSYFPSSFYGGNKNKYSERAAFSKGSEQRVPYTMLVPPPLDVKNALQTPKPIQQTTPKPVPLPTVIYTTPPTTTMGTTAQVTVQAAKLVYQSSSLSDESEWSNKNQYATVASSIGWRESTHKPFRFPSTTTNQIQPDYKEEIVYNTHLQAPESYIHIEFNPHNDSNKPLIAADSNHNINYVTPPPLIKSDGKEVMYKGEVTDDNIDISNAYVKIGKTEAQMHSTGLDMSNIPPEAIIRHPMPMVRPSSNLMMYNHMKHPIMANEIVPKMSPLTMQTIQQMQTMQPPPITLSPVYTKTTSPIFKILQKELETTTSVPPIETTIMTFVATTPTTTTTTTTPQPTTSEKPTSVSSTTSIKTTTSEVPTSTTTPLTTDPLFKHYKQPAEPMKGPLYLIIQGHSKVKTYGPTKQIHGISVQETNEISDEKEDGYQVKHLHGFKENGPRDEQLRQGRSSGELQTLKHVVQTGLGALDLADLSAIRRNYQQAELQVGYEVASGKDVTSEKYHKGIVEEARKLKI